jgi:hypothetical protein
MVATRSCQSRGLVAIYSKSQYNHWALRNPGFRAALTGSGSTTREMTRMAEPLLSENVFMNKLFAALIAGAFAFA